MNTENNMYQENDNACVNCAYVAMSKKYENIVVCINRKSEYYLEPRENLTACKCYSRGEQFDF